MFDYFAYAFFFSLPLLLLLQLLLQVAWYVLGFEDQPMDKLHGDIVVVGYILVSPL